MFAPLRASAFALCSLPFLLSAASAQTPSWIIPDLLQAAKAEGSLTIYSSMNEQEGLPLWKKFEEATGIKTEYVRANDNALMARTAIERRAQQIRRAVAVRIHIHRLARQRKLRRPTNRHRARRQEHVPRARTRVLLLPLRRPPDDDVGHLHRLLTDALVAGV